MSSLTSKILCLLGIFIISFQLLAAKEIKWDWQDDHGFTVHNTLEIFEDGSWHFSWVIVDAWEVAFGKGEVTGPGSPNPEDPSSGPKGYTPSDPTGIISAIEKGIIGVVPKEYSELVEFLEKNGASIGPVTIWNPSDDGIGGVGISGGVGGDELKAILAKIDDLKNSTEIYGSGSGGFIDEMGEFNPDWNTGTPPGGGSGGGDGDGDGDGNTDRMASDMGFSSSDDLVIHPQANPAP